jgi:hypothetical protein
VVLARHDSLSFPEVDVTRTMHPKLAYLLLSQIPQGYLSIEIYTEDGPTQSHPAGCDRDPFAACVQTSSRE